MKTTLFCLLMSLFVYAETNAQDVPVTVYTKEGKTIEVKHFGQLDCSGNMYFDNYILIKGKFNEQFTELKDYSKIQTIEFKGFEKEPIPTGGNEKGEIILTRKNGVRVALEEAIISLSCYGVEEQYNELQLQTVNPLTDEVVEAKINVKDIQRIVFK
jgi:hypothetical protein